ncbi:DUF2007 domain-containing protein [Paracoccus subflavus]|uniref:DUF2007 domain-containing protein n=1 Tax=Paracoccus subflavus TaxID=2528244 RepID=A0A4Q9G2N2_9RHOB|nr:DUF2007 domain-containing protein [Paracoccus subflavus]TBN39868.1 DUF2007 domain-containing protein [Paracoccus subflavus]
MKELFRSNDPVRMSRALSLLEDEGIVAFQMDQHMSVLEGSLGILPQRLMVADRDEFMARAILRDAGLDE